MASAREFSQAAVTCLRLCRAAISSAASRSIWPSFSTRLRNCSSVLNSAARKARRQSSATFNPITCAPMHTTLTSSCSTHWWAE